METKLPKQKKWLVNVLLLLFIVLFLFSAIYLFLYYYRTNHSQKDFKELKALIATNDSGKNSDSESSNQSNGNTDFFTKTKDGKKVLSALAPLYEKNTDFIGWLTIKDTSIDYPVMQTPSDETYYLHRSFDKKNSKAGTLFLAQKSDATDSATNQLIYGHNMKAGTMFHDLIDYEKESFYKKHKIISFQTIYGSGTYEIIAAFKTKIYPEDYAGFRYDEELVLNSKKSFQSYVENCKKLTTYHITATASYGDSLLTLSTCAYHTTDGRMVVVARKKK